MTGTDRQPTFLFHDYGTFGTHPTLDHPAQLAAIRTDSKFNVIGEPEIFYYKPADGYPLQPGAVLIIGITPQKAWAKGGDEAAFTARVHSLFTIPETCILGYNNVCFDDEVTCNIFYHNFYDPYAWSWQHDNSCWDLLDIMHACYAPRPGGINQPESDDGLPSFRLEHLTKASSVEYGNTHGAVTNVYATTAMAKLIKTRQPRLFDYLFTHRNKHKLMALIDVPQMKPLVHVSGIFGAWRGNTSWVTPLTWRSEDRNTVIMVDLAGDTSPLLELNSDILRERLYTVKADLGDNAAVLVKPVHISKCPVLAQANTLRPEDADQLEINRQHCLDNLKILRENPQVREEVVAIFAEAEPSTPSDDVGVQLYNGLFNDADRVAMKIVLKTELRSLPALDITSIDKRIEKPLFSYQARSFLGMLDYTKQQRQLEHHHQIFTPEFLQDYAEGIQMLAQQYTDDREKVALLKALQQYTEEIV